MGKFMGLIVRVALAVWLVTGPAQAAGVGFALLHVPDGANPPLDVGVWYPTDAPPRPTDIGLFTQDLAPDAPLKGTSLPLVVMSHGTGGDFAGHSDTAFALAQAGFVAAALTHTGDNWRDQSRALDLAGRARQLSALIGFMIASWKPDAVDPARVGAFGFSSGGMTVLVAAGGVPDLDRVGPHCAAHPSFFDCRLMREHGGAPRPAPEALTHDGRIRAIVVAAPALGFAFGRPGLRDVTMPVQLWRAADDTILPNPFYAEAVRRALPAKAEFHLVPHAGHFDFLAPCSEALAQRVPEICVSEAGFDRARFHAVFNQAVVAFFTRTLAVRK